MDSDKVLGDEPTDLVSRARDGDQDALSALLERAQPKMTAAIRSIVRSDAEVNVAEVLQEAFIVVIKKLPMLDVPERFDTWATTIARNAALQQLRKRQRLAVTHSLLEVEPKSGHEDRFESAERLLEALAELPEMPRQLLSLLYVDGLSYREVATQLGLQEATVRHRRNRSLRLLRNAMERDSTTTVLDKLLEGIDKSQGVQALAQPHRGVGHLAEQLEARYRVLSTRCKSILDGLADAGATGVGLNSESLAELIWGEDRPAGWEDDLVATLDELHDALPTGWAIAQDGGRYRLATPSPLTHEHQQRHSELASDIKVRRRDGTWAVSGDDSATQKSLFTQFPVSSKLIDPSPEVARAFLTVVADGSLHQEISAGVADDPDLTL